jgi:hypothetical protein
MLNLILNSLVPKLRFDTNVAIQVMLSNIARPLLPQRWHGPLVWARS